MTVPVQTPFVKYTGNGVTTVFTYPFKVLDIADIAVTVNGVVTAFTASGIGDNTGQVTISPAPVNASIVKISRNMVYQRTTDYQNNGALLENVLDDDLDNVVLMLQQLKYFADRAFAFGEIMPGINMELPLPAAGKALIWNPAGAALINSTANPDTLAGSEAAAVAAAATASAASATATAAALIIAGFEYKLNWATATVYAKNNLFSDSGNTYIVLIAHTSAALLTTDITANRVKLFAQKGNAGVGTGDLLAANNLSEVNAGVARTNLGLAIGTNVQAFDANTAKTNAAQTYTAAQRGALYL